METEEEEVIEKKVDIYDLYDLFKNSPFRQQQLPAWRPVPTVLSTVLILMTFGLIFIAIGIVLLVVGRKADEIEVRYDGCKGDPCNFKFKLEDDFEQNNIVYYGIDNFYQIHRVYASSRNNDQLNGNYYSLKEMEDDGSCDPAVTNGKMGKKNNFNGNPLNPSDVATPCGLVAKTFFQDTFKLYYCGNISCDENGENVTINDNNISWKKDRDKLFKNTDKMDKQWIDMKDEHFIVWMRPPMHKNFRKIWGRIEQNLKAGWYRVEINSTFPVSSFKGKKYFVISTVTKLGGKNTFMGIAYISCGGICILLIIAVIIGSILVKKKSKEE